MLWSVQGVQRVSEIVDLSYNNLVRARVEVDSDPQVAERIFEAASEAGVVLRELRAESASLEDVFAELTTTEVMSEAEAQALKTVREQKEKS
ncbi:MAG: hypothetical protein IPJ88_13810 [Myxococcales bacterium]|nr:MAG: hypothetical protein IPJ88_13810 [Myxococcales bacterium]